MIRKTSLIILIAIYSGGCVWIDDDGPCCDKYLERIIYINQTSCEIDNFIDDRYVGTVLPYSELHISGYDYEGYHDYFSRSVECDLTWGPTEFYLDEGETFRIYLENGGMSYSRMR